MAGKASLVDDHAALVGPIGVTGCDAANRLAAEADVVLAVGTRLQDFTTGSWTVFADEAMRLVSVNVARHDAVKHLGLAVQGDARETLAELSALLGLWRAPAPWTATGTRERAAQHAFVDANTAVDATAEPSYAEVVGAVNRAARPEDYVVAAAGGFPGELNVNWRSRSISSFDCEYGFSCMGYELSGAWGARMARPEGEVFVLCGDGSYLMMNSDLYSSVLYGHRLTVVLCDNGGFAVIDRLQRGQGGVSFMNQLDDVDAAARGDGNGPVRVDFAAHAAALGCETIAVTTVAELEEALERARSASRTTVIAMRTQADRWTPGGAFWEVGVPETSARPEVVAARAAVDEGKRRQRRGW
jgi:3D-(3,5/4)-trihydroxycyclohexane-1,2-dione acylhydrolase (decyclizing)